MGWLILSRAPRERIVITVPPSDKPTRVVVSVDEIRQERVRLGFLARTDVTVNREEVQTEMEGGDYRECQRVARMRGEGR